MDASMIAIISDIQQRNLRNRNRIVLRKRRREHPERGIYMYELVQTLIGKECQFVMSDLGNSIRGTIKSVKDCWVEIQTKKSTEMLNLDYVSRVVVLDK